jgi:hypothetical protein
MLKRRPSKRFVLAETGEETAWNTSTDNDPSVAPLPPPPQIEIGQITPSVSSTNLENAAVEEVVTQPKAQLLTVPTTLKSGMK